MVGTAAALWNRLDIWCFPLQKFLPAMPFRSKLLCSVLAVMTLVAYGAFGEQKTKDSFSYFTGVKSFSKFQSSRNDNGETVLLSPEIKSTIEWNELIVSWDAEAAPGTYLKVEASAIH